MRHEPDPLDAIVLVEALEEAVHVQAGLQQPGQAAQGPGIRVGESQPAGVGGEGDGQRLGHVQIGGPGECRQHLVDEHSSGRGSGVLPDQAAQVVAADVMVDHEDLVAPRPQHVRQAVELGVRAGINDDDQVRLVGQRRGLRGARGRFVAKEERVPPGHGIAEQAAGGLARQAGRADQARH